MLQFDKCKYFLLNSYKNKIAWIGDIVLHLREQTFKPSSPFCKICSNFPFCVNTCVAYMYYIVHKQINLTWTMIQLGTHYHLVVNGRCRKFVPQVKHVFHEEVSHSPFVTNSIITLGASKTFVFMHLLYGDGDDPMELLQSDKLNEMMDKFIEFCSLNIRNLVSSLKHCPTSQDYLSNIMSFKYKIGYDYIQDNYFPSE